MNGVLKRSAGTSSLGRRYRASGGPVIQSSRSKHRSKSSNRSFQVKNGSSAAWYAPARILEGG